MKHSKQNENGLKNLFSRKLAKLGILVLFLVALVGSAFALPVGFGNEEAKDAIEAGDYEAWKEAITNGLTEEKFNEIVEKYEERSEKRAEREEIRAEIKAAMDEGYDAWVEAIEGHPRAEKLLDIINEDNFETFVAMHDAKESGDIETAKELADELGLKGIGKKKGHFKARMHKK